MLATNVKAPKALMYPIVMHEAAIWTMRKAEKKQMCAF